MKGYRWALEHGFDRVVQMDADGQHPPKYVSVITQSHRGGLLVLVREQELRVPFINGYPVGCFGELCIPFMT